VAKKCIFCQVIAGELPSKKVYEDDEVLVINDINPRAPVHVLILPKEHIDSVDALEAKHQALVGKLFLVAQKVAKKLKVAGAYQLKVHVGKKAGQIIFHLHVHLLGGWKKPQHDK
jgi:histidine triad (HIT) family protein